jgi:hypothetical protein
MISLSADEVILNPLSEQPKLIASTPLKSSIIPSLEHYKSNASYFNQDVIPAPNSSRVSRS